MKLYPDVQSALQDALRLSEAMAYKFALSGMSFGGGKTVIAIPDDFDRQSRHALLRRYGELIQKLGGLFYTGPDVGTSSADMDIISETGAPYVFGRTPEAGGAGSSGPATALGVFSGMQIACEHIFGERSLSGRRVLVQGAGSVGAALMQYLRSAGADVLFSDVENLLKRLGDAQQDKWKLEEQVVSYSQSILFRTYIVNTHFALYQSVALIISKCYCAVNMYTLSNTKQFHYSYITHTPFTIYQWL